MCIYIIIYIYDMCTYPHIPHSIVHRIWWWVFGHTENQPGQGASQTTCHNHPVDRGLRNGAGGHQKNKWSFDGDRHCDLWLTFSFQFGIKNV